ncbi:hypothetical protein GC207_10470 [bacterium]|nr:hypothetical protein [bacterium]
MNLEQLKSGYPIPRAWRDLGLQGEPAKSCRSPFRDDGNPSFSVHSDGRKFHDFATGEGGSVVDFVMTALGCDTPKSIRWIEERLGVSPPAPTRTPATKRESKLPQLRNGSDSELRELSERRGFGVEALRLADDHGFLQFCELWRFPAWCITDGRAQLHEFRRLDGQKWPAFGRLHERKSHCTGSGKRWPIGAIESEPFSKVAMVEGAPDLLAAFHFLLVECKLDSVAPVAVLGASNHRLDPEALAHFAGKSVCLYPHVDEAGRKAAREWARQLKQAGAERVTAFDLSGLNLVDGTTGKDLADVCRIDPDCFEGNAKWREVMP